MALRMLKRFGTQLTLFTSDALFFSGDMIMTGEGHKDWLSDCDFHPGYEKKRSIKFII